VDIISLTRGQCSSAAARQPYPQRRAPSLVVQVNDEGTNEKRNATLASVSVQNSLHATQADAVTLSQTPLRRSRVAVVEHLLDDLLAEAVDQPPARTRQGRGSLVTAIDLDPRDCLGGLRHHRPYFGVRETSP
jgi:hypothetical protein